MKKTLQNSQLSLLVILALSFLIPQNAKADAATISGASVFINEIHYDNTGNDVGEFFEIAGPAFLSLAGYTVELYNGSNGTVYNTIALSGVIDDECASGMGAVDFQLPANGLQNGAPDGLALIDPAGVVIQFLSYEGPLTATNGAAVGMTATDIGISEPGTTPIGSSLQLSGMDGCSPGDFTWTGPSPASPGTKNTAQTFLVPTGVCASTILLINEIHYDNTGGDVGEFVEVAGTAGTDLTGYTLVPYNGSNGTTYNITALSGMIPDEGAGFGAIAFPISGLQNGAPDGVALVDPNGLVLQFINYEGTTITATNGPAMGMTSTNIGVSEPGSTPIGQSLQQTGTGSFASSFTWGGPLAETPGLLNVGQTLVCPVACNIVEITTSNFTACVFDGMSSTFTADVTVTFTGAPATGTLDLTGDGTASVAVTALVGSTHTFPAVVLAADNMTLTFTATFSDDTACTFTKADAGTAIGGCAPSSCMTDILFINEFHYDNTGGDVGEFVEVAGTSGINLVGYSLVLYNGSNGTVYNTINLSGVIDNEGAGFGAVDFQLPANGLQNGSPDGIALVQGACVLEFISYEGGLVAVGGPADGMMSMDVGLEEPFFTPVGESLQLTGTGSMSMDFAWTGPTANTAGSLNAGQTITCPTACGISSISINNVSACGFANGVSTFTADVKVLFDMAPPTGTLELSGDATGSIPVSMICGNIATFQSITLPADGAPINFTAAFSDDAACTLTAVAGTAPEACCPPEAVCQDATVNVTEMGDITLDPTVFDGGTMFCAMPTFTVAPAMFTCTDVGQQTVTLTATDPVSGITSTCTATASIIASQFCVENFSPITTNFGGPSISDPCECAGNGLFNEEVFIQSNTPGQMWTISNLTGSLAPWNAGDVITDNGNGTFSAVGQHADGVGFAIELQSIFWPGLTLGISNVCYYPAAVIENDFNAVCTGAILETLVGNAGLQSDGVTPVAGTGVFTINGVVSTIFDPLVLGAGTHTVEFCFDAGDASAFSQVLDAAGVPIVVGPPSGVDTQVEAQDDPGCETCVTQEVTIEPNVDEMICNDLVNITITDEGCTLVGSDQILEGDYLGCYDAYIIDRVHDLSGSCGNDAPRGFFWINCDDVGNTITLKVIDPISGNSCWGDVHVDDKVKPVLECEVTYTDISGNDQVGTVFNLTCAESPDDIDLPTPIDNCDNERDLEVNLLSQTSTGDVCDVETITRVYQTGDRHGNASNICTYEINIIQPTLGFPSDTTFSCQAFANNPNVISPTANGSGEPNSVGQNCRFSVTFLDQRLEACEGVDIETSFKILRTWTVLNWCSGEITNSLQVIKVIDLVAPEFSFPVDHNGDRLFNTTLIADQASGEGSSIVCSASGLIPVPVTTDDCSGVTEIRVFTPAGEGIPVLNGNGDLIGFSIPSPFLPEGEHEITFEATDGCGNTGTETVEFEVIDGVPPIPVCRELTQIALSAEADGVTTVTASDFDEGSYDDCGPVYLKVRRMNDNCPGFSDDRRRFNDEINFCCEDIGSSIMVVLRVYDANPGPGSVTTGTEEERSNDCMIEVLLEDKIRPLCAPPADMFLTCDELPEGIDYDDDAAIEALFGTATAVDNCNATIQLISNNDNFDLCGVGTVTRTFRAEDDFGNISAGVCRQVITVQNVTDYCITFPEDYEGECDNTNAPDDLTFVENGCDLLAISSEEKPFNAGGPAGDECRKVLRTWRAINWCEYDGVSMPTLISRDGDNDGNIDDGEYCSTGSAFVFQSNRTISYPSTGYYEWVQNVTIYDDTPPEIAHNGATKFCGGDLDEDPCTGQVDIELDITELCTDALTTTWSISAFSDSFGSADFNGNDAVSTRLPLGMHTVRFYVSDDCGNTSQLDITFTIVDCKAPTPVCFNGLSIDVMPASGMVELWAIDFNASSFDYCSDFDLRLNVVEDRNGDGFITNDDYLTTLPADDFIIIDCDDVASGVTMVQMWVAEQDGTADDRCADNQDNDFCVTFVQVQDNNGVCSSSRATVAGKITNESNETVENVTVDVNANASMFNSMTTTSNGEYQFALPLGGDYSVTPMRNDDVANGVSTFDLVLISKHILNVSSLDSPYKMLAADANRSGSISTLDLVSIRKVVLRLTNEFPNNTSWRFVEKSHVFTNGNNPWSSSIPELMNMNNLATDQLASDFIAVKVGDVNGNATANGILGVDERSFNGNFEFNVEEQSFKAGEQVKVVFNANDLKNVDGYQFTLKFNEKALELTSIENGVATADNFGTAMTNNGYITASWNGTATDNEAFTMIFNAKATGTLSNEIAISSALTNAEAYVGNDYKNVSINFGSDVATNEFALYQNTPNPFKGETVIGFDLPTATTATLTVSDVSGKILKVVNGDFAKGYNTVTLGSDELSSGVLYYQLDTEEFTKTMKMVVIK